MRRPTVKCVECERTFWRDKFSGIHLPHRGSVCVWCLDPSVDLLDGDLDASTDDESTAKGNRLEKLFNRLNERSHQE